MSVLLEYIWLDSKNDFRSKTRVIDVDTSLDGVYFCPKNNIIKFKLLMWNYDGSSTGQAEGKDSEVFLIPVATFNDPFRKNYSSDINSSYLIWCEMVDKNMVPLKNSNRTNANKVFKKHEREEPWFGLEQEYFIVDPKSGLPLGFSSNPTSNPEPQGKYYCGVGADKALCRIIPETHLQYCLYAGIKICGINAEVAPAQWEYQIGPCKGITASDHLWVSRYILNRIAESHGFNISYHPKPLGVETDWNGSGCHTNFSTKLMREEKGIEHIYTAIKRLSKNHNHHMKYYGEHNRMRMSGHHETSSFDNFTFGRANRGASIRIPNFVLNESKGYFEDRRPASNCDPYLVTSLIMETCMNTQLDTVPVPVPVPVPVAQPTDEKFDILNLGYII
jgi:glutamine synthetase